MTIEGPRPVASIHPALPPEGLLTQYSLATRKHLRWYLESDAPEPFLDPLVADYPARGGKMMRPAICIANARIFGEVGIEVMRCATAVELLHNALLIHDDVQDGSDMRRGGPTLHAMHGVPLAINAGDALMFTAFRPLLDAVSSMSPHVGRQVLEVTITMARQTAEGQALELGWRDRNISALSQSDYFRMALKKTAWMGMIWPAQLGCIVGSRGRADPDKVIRFGHFLGVAFQIEDDLRNLSLDPAYGKEQNGDIYEAKRTLMLIHVRNAASSEERRRINRFLGLTRAYRSEEDVLWLVALMRRHGSIKYARQVAAAMAGAALQEFHQTYGDVGECQDRQFLAGLVRWVFDRP